MTSYALRINAQLDKHPILSQIFSYSKKQALSSVWQYEITEDDQEFPIAIEVLIRQIKKNRFAIEALNIELDDLSIWYLYEYEGQCNMEFTPTQLSSISKLGLTLCISCWEKGSI